MLTRALASKFRTSVSAVESRRQPTAEMKNIYITHTHQVGHVDLYTFEVGILKGRKKNRRWNSGSSKSQERKSQGNWKAIEMTGRMLSNQIQWPEQNYGRHHFELHNLIENIKIAAQTTKNIFTIYDI